MADGKRLYIRTGKGIEPIDPAIVEKYGLKPGMWAPFSDGVVVGMDETPGADDTGGKERIDTVKGELVNDNIAQLDNGMTLQTSEMIDIAKAEDSVVRTGEETY
jgi:hypothetical protein